METLSQESDEEIIPLKRIHRKQKDFSKKITKEFPNDRLHHKENSNGSVNSDHENSKNLKKTEFNNCHIPNTDESAKTKRSNHNNSAEKSKHSTLHAGYCSADSACSLSNVNQFREYNIHEIMSNEDDVCSKAIYTDDADAELCVPSRKRGSETTSSENNVTKKKLTQKMINDYFGGKTPRKEPKESQKNAFYPKQIGDIQYEYKNQNARKEYSSYKKIPGTNFAVDAFCYGEVVGCTSYFLSHFHSDHYRGLKKSFNKKLYCSKITANLVETQINVPSQYIHVLPMDVPVDVEGVKVTLIDANHCPGAVMFFMELPNNQRILHVGDFRAHSTMLTNPFISSKPIDTIYLDTTYCHPKYTFPSQCDVIDFVIQTIKMFLKENKRTLFVCGTYSIGKEKIFKAIADDQNIKIGVTKAKYDLLNCFEDKELSQRMTLDYTKAQLHILPLGKMSFKTLQDHFELYKTCGYDRILAFKPTGWTFNNTFSSLQDIKPFVRGVVTMYGIPYSEHSSFDELKQFISVLKPKTIIPTVNIRKKESRDAMNGHFKEWLSTENTR